LIRENKIESHRKYIKIYNINSYLILRDAENEYKEEKINLFSECKCE